MKREEDQEESGAVIAGSSMWVDKHVGGTKQKDAWASASVGAQS